MRPSTPHATALFGIVQKAKGRWVTRVEIARAIDRKRLNPWDVQLLTQMVNDGLIEVQERPSRIKGISAFEYRVPKKTR